MYRLFPITVLALIGYISYLCWSLPAERQAIRIALSPWPAYELLYLAQDVGIFEELDLDVDLVEINSLADIRRAFERGRVDAMCCTLIEAVEAIETGDVDGKVILFTDFSEGGDVILGNRSTPTFSSLKGGKIGVETAALGSYILQRALEINRLDNSAIDVVPMEQSTMGDALRDGNVDAVITYPPFSLTIREATETRVLFDSAQIPGEIADVLVLSSRWIHKDQSAKRLREAWDRAIAYLNRHPTKSIEIMARREGISPTDFALVLEQMQILSTDEQTPFFTSPEVHQTIRRIQAMLLPPEHRQRAPGEFLQHD